MQSDGLHLPVFGEAVVVERLVPGDAARLSLSHSDPENARFQGWASPLSEAEAAAFIADQDGGPVLVPGDAVQLAIRRSLGGPLAGDLWVDWSEGDGSTVDVGITLLPAMQGRGLATDAIIAISSYLLGDRSTGVRCLGAWIDTENAASLALFERCGFTQVGDPTPSTRRDGSPASELRFEKRT